MKNFISFGGLIYPPYLNKQILLIKIFPTEAQL